MDMKKIWRWILITLGIIVPVTACEKPDLQEEFYDYSAIEKQVLYEINHHRASISLTTLKINNVISRVCYEHSKKMADTLSVTHEHFAERAYKLMNGINSKSVGEVVAFGYVSSTGVVNGWIRSESHKRILEQKGYTDFGISATQNDKGRYYFTVIFTRQ